MNSYQSYKIVIEKKAQKFINNLSDNDRKKIVKKIANLRISPIDQLPIKKLQGYKNVYRLKVGDYRVIYVVISDQKMLVIAVIGHRKEVYDIAKRLSL